MEKIILIIGLLFLSNPMISQKINVQDGDKIITINEERTFLYDTIYSYQFDNLLETKIDKMTGDTISTNKKNLFINSGYENKLLINFIKIKHSDIYDQKYNSIKILFSIIGKNNVCIDKYSKCYILFRDGSKIDFVNNYGFNCKSNFLILFMGGLVNDINGDLINQLKNKSIETIRVWTYNSGYVECNLTKQQSDDFSSILKCIHYDDTNESINLKDINIDYKTNIHNHKLLNSNIKTDYGIFIKNIYDYLNTLENSDHKYGIGIDKNGGEYIFFMIGDLYIKYNKDNMYIRNKNDKISYNIRYQVTGYQYFFLNKDSSPLNRKSLEHELTKDVFYNIQNLITEIDNKFIIKKIK
jgi:hypothetical protein